MEAEGNRNEANKSSPRSRYIHPARGAREGPFDSRVEGKKPFPDGSFALTTTMLAPNGLQRQHRDDDSSEDSQGPLRVLRDKARAGERELEFSSWRNFREL